MRPVLPVIVVSQFLCTSLWFAGNAIAGDIAEQMALGPGFLAHLTSAIQFGFIVGTLVFAVFAVSDRFSPSRVFFASAILAGLFNLGISLADISPSQILAFRFLTGFFLAGIYPVGMKIASDYYQKGLGKSLGFLVGALVLGTAFPHLLKSMGTGLDWQFVVYITSALAAAGGLAILLLVPDGPFRRPAQKLKFTAFLDGFRQREFRAAAFGYFGHMWELYTFWAFVPVILATFRQRHPAAALDVPLLSFGIIGLGSLACAFGGLLSQRLGAKPVATGALLLSCLCCLASPLFVFSDSAPVLIGFLFFWGLVVIADSPLFSTLVAQSAPEKSRGTSLTIVNCLGFALTILSLQFVNFFSTKVSSQYLYLLLAIGPALGLAALLRKRKPAAKLH